MCSSDLRLFHDSYLCEVIRPDSTEAVAPGGGRGELVLTTLGRDACPLIRYRTGDLVEPVPPESGDPAAFILKGGILGRVDDMVVVRGVNLYPSAVDAAVRAVPGIREYRVEIDRRGTLPQVTLEIEPDGSAGDPAEIGRAHV